MKTLIISAALLLSVAFNASASNVDPANEKVIKTFKLLFKNAENVIWSNTENFYQASFTKADISTRAIFDSKGKLVQTIRYYKETFLPANVLYSVKKEFSGMDIWGVTEVSNDKGVNYRIVLLDNEHYTHINANDAGETEVVNQYDRGDK
ncbi:MAG TPA: hypothetical protein PKY86_04645 [Niabella sp.]|nr:hypothetical protein [Niabella sp.]HQW15849.1 hypothetical protein [Niabella sp.]HQX21061.1 hypothetical protein [Niabella sp.]HQX40882.1 hypothetical protein [Niabella sp.]HRB36890.1 hypothetical protein [Niabella sp.]